MPEAPFPVARLLLQDGPTGVMAKDNTLTPGRQVRTAVRGQRGTVLRATRNASLI